MNTSDIYDLDLYAVRIVLYRGIIESQTTNNTINTDPPP